MERGLDGHLYQNSQFLSQSRSESETVPSPHPKSWRIEWALASLAGDILGWVKGSQEGDYSHRNNSGAYENSRSLSGRVRDKN